MALFSSLQSTLLNEDEEEDVLVKTVVAGSSEAQSQIMISEGTSLHGLMQQHIQTILAATWDGTSPMLVYPYAKHGNLKRWLLASGQSGVSTHVVVSLGLQMLKVNNLQEILILHSGFHPIVRKVLKVRIWAIDLVGGALLPKQALATLTIWKTSARKPLK